MKREKVSENLELVAEWDDEVNFPLRPEDVTMGSGKMVGWKCKKGHSYFATINHRLRGDGCPYCSNHKVLKGYNDLATHYPDLAEEWDYEKNYPLKPEDVIRGSSKKVYWKCKKGHRYSARIYGRCRGDGCPYCANHKVLKGYNDLATHYPDLAEEWDYEENYPLKPDDVTKGSKRKVYWKCKKGHNYSARIDHRVNGSGCSYCANHKVLKGFNDLATLYPDLAEEWDYEKNTFGPDEVSCHSQKKVWWRCSECGSSYRRSVVTQSRASGCKICKK